MEESEYQKMYEAEDSHWWYVGLHELILYFVNREKSSKGPLKILDAGCGTGRLCQLMKEFGDVSGCDISDIALELCANRNISAFRTDLNFTDLGTEKYDVITSIDVLYHKQIQDDSDILMKFLKALKPGGVLILNLPAYNLLKSRHDLAVHTRERCTKSALTEKLKEAGFAIEKATYRIGFLFPVIALYRLMQRRMDKPVSDVSMPSKPVNQLLLGLNRMENFFIEKVFTIPFGSSLFLVARKPV